MNSFENRPGLIGYKQALQLSLDHVRVMPEETCLTMESLGRVASREIKAVVNLPSNNSSLKDGYALKSADIQWASPSNPVLLKVDGTCHAGQESSVEIVSGKAVRVMSGATIPKGADAVLAEEFSEFENGVVKVVADSHVGRNILWVGSDIRCGETLLNRGELITPSKAALLAAGGIMSLSLVKLPEIGLLATGDEIALLGKPLREGMVYASNVALQQAWLSSHGIGCNVEISGDSLDRLTGFIDAMTYQSDVIITSGGAWTGDRDLVTKALDRLNWKPVFHRVRMGPGKAVGMGLLREKPVFCLPGGPPSNEMAFLMIVLPAISIMLGRRSHFIPRIPGLLSETLEGQIDWTQFAHCDISMVDGEYHLRPLDMSRRLTTMGRAQAVVEIPEGVSKLECGTKVIFYATGMDFSQSGS